MNTVSKSAAIISMLSLLGCNSPNREKPPALTAQFVFSSQMAEKITANNLLDLLRSGDYKTNSHGSIEADIEDENERTHIRFVIPSPRALIGEPLILHFSNTESRMDEELLTAEQMAGRLQAYREAA